MSYENPKGLRVIKTARTEKEINNAANNGFWPLVKPVIPSPKIKSKYAIVQDPITGKIEVLSDFRSSQGMAKVIDFTFYYPHHFPSPFAAYLIPKGLKPGETVWLEDIIEDIVATRWNQGDAYRLNAYESVWNGVDFLIDFEESFEPGMIG